jgi:hypothetical protein
MTQMVLRFFIALAVLPTLGVAAQPSSATLPTPEAVQPPSQSLSDLDFRGTNFRFTRSRFAPLNIQKMEVGQRTRTGEIGSLILTGVTSQQDGLKFSAGKIILTGDTNSFEHVDVMILDWFNRTRLLELGDLPDNPKAVSPTSVTVENLRIETQETNHETVLSAQLARFSGVQTAQIPVPLDVEEHLVFNELELRAFTHSVRSTMFYNTPFEPTSDLKVQTIAVKGLHPDAFVRKDLKTLVQLLLSFQADAVSVDGFAWIETPLRRTQTAIQQRSTIQFASAKMDQLNRGAFARAEMKGFQTESERFGRASNLAVDRMVVGGWNNRAYTHLLSLMVMANRSPTSVQPLVEQATFANLWPGGPLDIGIGEFLLSGIRGNLDGYRLSSRAFRLTSQRTNTGPIRTIEVRPGTLTIQGPTPPADAPATIFQRLGLERLVLSWQFKARFDPLTDTTYLDRFSLVAERMGGVQAHFVVSGVEAARRSQNVIAALNWLTRNLVPSHTDRPQEDRPSTDISPLGTIRLIAARVALDDTGGLDRLITYRLRRNNPSYRPTPVEISKERLDFFQSLKQRWHSSANAGHRSNPFNTRQIWDGLTTFLQHGGRIEASFANSQGVALKEVTADNHAFTTNLTVQNSGQRGNERD